MSNDSESEKKTEQEYPLRRKAVIKLRKGKEIPVVISCRADGVCVILPQSMRDLMFPKVVEREESKGGE